MEESELSYGPGEWAEIGRAEGERGMVFRPPTDDELAAAYRAGYEAGKADPLPPAAPRDWTDIPL